MCEMISESCLVMVVIRQLRSFTSVPYYYESHSSPRAGLTRRPEPPSEIVDPAESNEYPTRSWDGYDHSENQPRCDRFQSSPSLPRRWMGKNRPREQQDVTAICRSLTARDNCWRKNSAVHALIAAIDCCTAENDAPERGEPRGLRSGTPTYPTYQGDYQLRRVCCYRSTRFNLAEKLKPSATSAI